MARDNKGRFVKKDSGVDTIKAFKAFDKDMKCQGMQYEVGKTYECAEAVLCKTGFHFCEWPLDCFVYYAPADGLYAEIEADGQITGNEIGGDSKRACTKITIKRMLTTRETCALELQADWVQVL